LCPQGKKVCRRIWQALEDYYKIIVLYREEPAECGDRFFYLVGTSGKKINKSVPQSIINNTEQFLVYFLL
jgi:hypothetical protein